VTVPIDSSEIQRLVADLSRAAAVPGVFRAARKAVERSARRVKDGWNGKLYTEGHAKLTGRAISYTMSPASQSGISAEVGAVLHSGKQAGLVQLLE
jgi:hypothetical protein